MSGGIEDAAYDEQRKKDSLQTGVTIGRTEDLSRPCYAPLRNSKSEINMVPETASSKQVGGNHYKDLKIQPMEYSMANGLNACQHTAIKYVTRYKSKGGIEDLKKAIHSIELLIEFEEKGK